MCSTAIIAHISFSSQPSILLSFRRHSTQWFTKLWYVPAELWALPAPQISAVDCDAGPARGGRAREHRAANLWGQYSPNYWFCVTWEVKCIDKICGYGKQNLIWQPPYFTLPFRLVSSVNVLCVLIDHPFTISQSPQIYHTTAILLLLRGMEFGVSETRVMKNGCLVNANNMLGM